MAKVADIRGTMHLAIVDDKLPEIHSAGSLSFLAVARILHSTQWWGPGPAADVLGLPPHELGKDPCIAGIAAGEPAWLGGHTKEPLAPDPLDPAGCPATFARQKINRRPNANRRWNENLLVMTMNPQFLLRRSQTHQKQVCLSCGK
jgi:hypothetical protein